LQIGIGPALFDNTPLLRGKSIGKTNA